MNSHNDVLRKRLDKIWERANFALFFQDIIHLPAKGMKKGAILFNEGDKLDKLYYIKEGYVKLYRLSKEGKESTIYLFGPGHILGIRALFAKDEKAKHTAQALTDLNAITISRKNFFDEITKYPEFLVDFMHLILNRLDYTERKLEGFVTTDATNRVANFLFDCALRFGEKKNGKVKLPLKLTHQQIAEFVGSFRETVTVALKRLEKVGIIKIEKGEITITDPIKLKPKTYDHQF